MIPEDVRGAHPSAAWGHRRPRDHPGACAGACPVPGLQINSSPQSQSPLGKTQFFHNYFFMKLMLAGRQSSLHLSALCLPAHFSPFSPFLSSSPLPTLPPRPRCFSSFQWGRRQGQMERPWCFLPGASLPSHNVILAKGHSSCFCFVAPMEQMLWPW